MTDTPEIKRLREQSWQEEYDTPGGPRKHPPVVDLDDAIQAVRNTEARAFREVVEALRDQADMLDPTFRGWQGAAQFIERTFLSPDNPEGQTCQCWNEGEWGRVHREDCPIHRNPEGNA